MNAAAPAPSEGHELTFGQVLALLWRATGRGRCALLGYGVLFGALVFVDISLVSIGLTLYFILIATWLLVVRARIAAVLRQLLQS